MLVGGCNLALALSLLLSTGDESATADDAAVAVGNADAEVTESPEIWIRHRVHPFEDLGVIATRYGVSVEQLQVWNGLEGKSKTKPGKTLRVKPTVTPPPVSRHHIIARKKETWAKAADRAGVTVDALRGWNKRFARRKRPPKGAKLNVWIESRVVRYPLPAFDQPLPEVVVDPGGYSIGTPNRGRIENAVRIPESEAYTIRFDRQCYGTTLAVHGVAQAITAFREETGFSGNVTIGAMSRQKGRRLRPHRSHQSGRDADIRLPALRHAKKEATLTSREVDWPATYALLDAFVRTGDVHVIFFDRKFFNKVRLAGRRLGASDERIHEVMKHLRHNKGHVHHFHVRFECSPEAEKCEDT
jgi:murein endopeptidase/LysM repeat protein